VKNFIICLTLLISLPSAQPVKKDSTPPLTIKPAENLFIITIDGFRWQELFSGADPLLINDETCTPDTATMKMMYWEEEAAARRKKLLPFFWNVLAKKGQLYGNRQYNNQVNTANIYTFSYPGYNEIFTGNTDILVASNKKKKNSNKNILEYLNAKEAYKGKVVAFTSWDVFPFILNEERSGLLINSGYENMGHTSATHAQQMIDKVQTEAVNEKSGTRYDQLTFLTAKEYLQKNKPKVLFLGLGETDEYAHHGRYDLYLQQANKVDKMLEELWHWVQSSPAYKDNTTFLITTDHGRGTNQKWTSHSTFIKGSSQTWLAMIGPGIEPLGEIKQAQQLYQQQLASLMASLLGESFGGEDMVWGK
jgi:predicted AlkP superfamily pyrophosphatase or phosphodiesterase